MTLTLRLTYSCSLKFIMAMLTSISNLSTIEFDESGFDSISDTATNRVLNARIRMVIKRSVSIISENSFSKEWFSKNLTSRHLKNDLQRHSMTMPTSPRTESVMRTFSPRILRVVDMNSAFITLYFRQVVLRVCGVIKTMPKIRPFMRRKPGQKKRTIHVKGHYRHAHI